MEQELRKEIEILKRRISLIEQAQNIEFIENVNNQQIRNRLNFDDTGITGAENGTNAHLRDYILSGLGETITTLDIPDGFLVRKYKTKDFLIPYYNRQ